MNKNVYTRRLHALLSPSEHRVFGKLNSPRKIQDYLDTLSINFELRGETLMSPRRVIRGKSIHCIEGALFAAASLAYHGYPPLLMDFQTVPDDEDHVLTIFQEKGLWGALSKTNHVDIRYRDPVYKTVRELGMSYFNEYYQWDGRKTLRAFSEPFDMRALPPERWVTTEEDMWWIEKVLDDSPHEPALPKSAVSGLRRASKIELEALHIFEWNKNGTRRKIRHLPKRH